MLHTANSSDLQYFICVNPLKRLIFFSLTHIKIARFNYLYALQLKYEKNKHINKAFMTKLAV